MNRQAENSPASRSTEAQRCQCEGDDLGHSHCMRCGDKPAGAEGLCERCAEKEQQARKAAWEENRKRNCSVCGGRYDPGEASVLTPEREYEVCGRECLHRASRKLLPGKLAESGVPRKYRGCTFEDFDQYTPRLREQVSKLKAIAGGRMERGVFLFGGVGTGKTHLATALMSELIVRQQQGFFVDGIELAMQFQGAFRKEETANDIVHRLLSGKFLLVDDLGAEKGTDYLRQSFLHLVNQAYVREKILLVTANLSHESLQQWEPRLASRLVEMCIVFKLEGQDFRVRSTAEQQKLAARTASRAVH